VKAAEGREGKRKENDGRGWYRVGKERGERK